MAFLSSSGSTNEVGTASIQVSAISTPISTISSHDNTTNLSDATVYGFLENQPNGSQLVHEDLEQILEDDLEEIDLKWQLALLSMRAKRSPKNQESRPRNQDSSRKTMNMEDTSYKAMVAIEEAGFDWSYIADDEVPTNMALMAFSDSEDSKSVCADTSNEIKEVPDASIIKDWVYDSDEDESEEMVIKSDNVQHKPEQANQPSKVSQTPKNNWNEMSTQKLGVENFAPTVVLTKSGIVLISTARQSSSGAATPVSAARPINTTASKSLVNALKNRNLNNNVNTAKANSVNTAKGNKVTSAVGNQGTNAVKSLACWKADSSQFGIRSPRETNSLVFDLQGAPKDALKDQGYFDSGCSRHMIGNISYLTDFKEHDGGYATFRRRAKGGKITGKGTIRTADESQVLLKVPRKNNMYNFDMKNIVPQKDLTCLLAKAKNDESMLWHMRLGDQLGKFDGKSDEGIFVGYFTTSKAFRVYNIRTRKGKGASFDAGQSSMETGSSQDCILMPLWKDNSLFDSSSQASDGHNQDKHGPSQASKSDNQEIPNAESSTKTVNTDGPVNTATPTYADYPNDPLMPDLEDVGIFDDAYDDRGEGVEADYNNLETMEPKKIYLLEKEPLEPNGSIETREIKEGLLSEIKPGWLILAYASFKDFTIYQMDVKSAFLYGTIKEEVYVSQPIGFVDPEFPDRVYKVEKALNGLHQAPRAWYETLSTYLLDNGLRRGTIDKILFIKKIKDDILLVQVYVDDIILGSTKRSLSTEFEQLMHKKFQISSMGELTFFLGLQVEQRKDGIFLSQDKYVLWLQNQLLDYGYNFMQTKIHVDNESVICVVKNHVYHLKTKHIEIRHHFIKDSYEKRLIEMHWFALSLKHGLKGGYLINDGYADLVQHADKKELAIPGQTATGKELSNPLMAESDGFEQIVDFLNANQIKYALTMSPTIYTSCIKQFWTTLKIKTVNDDVRLQALIDGKKVVITEASIRHDLKLNDVEGTSYLTNAMIFEELARMGAKTTLWNEFSSTMASAIICIANNQKFNFSKYILDNLKKNLEAGVPFYMFPRVGTGFSEAVTPLFNKMMVQAIKELDDLPTANQDTPIPDTPSSSKPQIKHKPRRKERKERKETEVSPTELPTEDPVPTPSIHPLYSGENSMPLKELMVLYTNLSNKVKSPAVKEIVVDQEKSSKQGRKIADIDADAEVNLENVYNLDLAHKETVLSMHDATDAENGCFHKEAIEGFPQIEIWP
nr:putative ribonuclease H-like domain-containing protein [Tanacetum cinerariifolium]